MFLCFSWVQPKSRVLHLGRCTAHTHSGWARFRCSSACALIMSNETIVGRATRTCAFVCKRVRSRIWICATNPIFVARSTRTDCALVVDGTQTQTENVLPLVCESRCGLFAVFKYYNYISFICSLCNWCTFFTK